MDDQFTRSERIAYSPIEIALRNEAPTYSGGLGVLAGDTVRSAANLEFPLVTVMLVIRTGYFRQEVNGEVRELEHSDTWEPGRLARLLRRTRSSNLLGNHS